MTIYAPPDIEAAVVTLLSSHMTVATKVPNPRPAAHTRVTAAGGNERNLIQSDARVIVECWGADDTAALGLARLAYAVLWGGQDSFIAPGVWVSQIQLTNPVNLPDPDTRSPRYQFVAQLTASLTEVSP
ncbi:hypothetical protein [Nocardioides jensenii]|uniref:hypothetical protein n=1 Tax=Nocardioides jensenii TaxID=1843 RepID=UPI000835593E|nr:hypothetical protein [Nocardioides jensenii]